MPKDITERKGKRLLSLAESIIKLSALLGVFGYMSLRAHLNYLGVSYTSSLGIERYLMETYNLVVTTFFPLVSVLLRISLALFLLYLLRAALARTVRRLNSIQKYALKIKAALTSITDMVKASCSKPIIPGLLVSVALAIYVWIQWLLDHYVDYDSVAVGSLRGDRLQGIDVVLPYYFICLFCIAGFFLHSIIARMQKTQPRARFHRFGRMLSNVFALALIALALHLPILYGRFVHSAIYDVVNLSYKVDDRSMSICGLLVLESSSSVLIWRAEKRVGRIIEIPRSQIQLMSSGSAVDLIKLAQEASYDDHAKPDCALVPDANVSSPSP